MVGDGAVGLLGVLAAQQLGAERIIAMSRHEPRQQLAREFGATDIVTERGDDGVQQVKDPTRGLGPHSVIEAVGTQEAMLQAIRSTRPGGQDPAPGSAAAACPGPQAARPESAVSEGAAYPESPQAASPRTDPSLGFRSARFAPTGRSNGVDPGINPGERTTTHVHRPSRTCAPIGPDACDPA